MKLFRNLFIAPAAVGLMAPIAATATEVNIDDVSVYARKPISEIQAPQSSTFSDVVSGDWAYTSLLNLIESYSCIDNLYTQNLKSGHALTRYEAAALINACLDADVASVDANTSDILRLTTEFGTEMAIIKGRRDGLESKSKDFNAGEFSSGTKISGEANFILGSTIYSDEDRARLGVTAAQTPEALHSKYSYNIDAITSFTGQDALVTGITAGSGYTLPQDYTYLDGTYIPTNGNSLEVTSLYYTRPFGNSDWSWAAGPLFKSSDLSPTITSSYSNKGQFKFWHLGPNALSNYDLSGITLTGQPGAAIAYINDSGWNAGANFISAGGSLATGGIFTDESIEITKFSVGYDSDEWGGGINYIAIENPTWVFNNLGYATLLAGRTSTGGSVFGVGGYWQVSDSFDVSLGVDIIDLGIANFESANSWAIGTDYDLGPGTLSAAMSNFPDWNAGNGASAEVGTMYEFYYDYPINDGISITPTIMLTSLNSTRVDQTSYAVKATFKF